MYNQNKQKNYFYDFPICLLPLVLSKSSSLSVWVHAKNEIKKNIVEVLKKREIKV
jgi:hypothetical protein